MSMAQGASGSLKGNTTIGLGRRATARCVRACSAWVLPLLLGRVALVLAAGDVATVVRINGAPVVHHAGATEPLRPGAAVLLGDVVETDGQSKVKLVLADDSVLSVGPQSRVTVQEFVLEAERRHARLQVLVGRFKIAIAKFLGGASDVEVRTPTAVAGVRGTMLWGDTEIDAFCVLDGAADVRPLSGAVPPAQLTTGQCVQQLGKGKVVPFAPHPEDLAAYLKAVTLD